MTSEVIVDVQKNDISIALLEDKRLVEFQRSGQHLLSKGSENHARAQCLLRECRI